MNRGGVKCTVATSTSTSSASTNGSFRENEWQQSGKSELPVSTLRLTRYFEPVEAGISGMIEILKGRSCREEVELHGRANRLCAEAGRVGRPGRGGVPQDGHFGRDVLQLA